MTNARNACNGVHVELWGKKDFRLSDPFGFYLRFTEPIDWSQPSDTATNNKEG